MRQSSSKKSDAKTNNEVLVSASLKLEQHDYDLLKEYGFTPRTIQSIDSNLKRIDEMNMRQLDRLKMLLLRNSSLCEGYPVAVRKGIERNNLKMFSKALVMLSQFFVSD